MSNVIQAADRFGDKAFMESIEFKAWSYARYWTGHTYPSVCKWQVSRGGVLVLQQRLNETAVREVWEDGRVVKGVGVFDGIRTSLRKL